MTRLQMRVRMPGTRLRADYDAGVAQADQDRSNAYSQAQALEEQAQELETQGSQLESQGDSEGAGAQYTQAEDLRQQGPGSSPGGGSGL